MDLGIPETPEDFSNLITCLDLFTVKEIQATKFECVHDSWVNIASEEHGQFGLVNMFHNGKLIGDKRHCKQGTICVGDGVFKI